jgi:hypothetical protein
VRSQTVLRGLAALCAAGLARPAPAAADPAVLMASRWPSLPEGHRLSLEDQITDRLTQLGNELGRHLDLVTHDMFQLRVDGRRRRAHVLIGGGNDEVALRVDGDIQFDDANAHVQCRLDLALHGHAVRLELPPFEMSPASYRGNHGVELRLPLFVQRF